MYLKLRSWLIGKKIGVDQFGNRYYQTRDHWLFRYLFQNRRWVIFNGYREASKVPAQWFGWLHYNQKSPPNTNNPLYGWQKPHCQNMTGSSAAYRPPLYSLQKDQKKDYQPWSPTKG